MLPPTIYTPYYYIMYIDAAAPKFNFFIFFSPNNLATRTTKKYTFLKIIMIYFLINFSYFSKQNMYSNRLTMQGVLRKPKIYVTNKKSTRHHHSRNIKSSLFVLEDFFLFLIIPCRLRSCQDENHHRRF